MGRATEATALARLEAHSAARATDAETRIVDLATREDVGREER